MYAADSGLFQAQVKSNGSSIILTGKGEGMIAAWAQALSLHVDQEVSVLHFDEHSLGQTTHSQAVAYVACQFDGGQPVYAVAIEQDSSKAALQAILNAVAQAKTVLKIEV